jgi:hypothetical protein
LYELAEAFLVGRCVEYILDPMKIDTLVKVGYIRKNDLSENSSFVIKLGLPVQPIMPAMSVYL